MLHSVIMAGGIGARFWPLSRRHQPKQMLDLLGEGTLIEQTVLRIAPLVPPENQWIVTNDEQKAMIRSLLPAIAERQFVVEPLGRNTAPAIGLSAVHLLHHDPDAVMIVLPADHRIADVQAFRDCLSLAVELVRESDVLATIGIRPLRPETGYGYIQVDHVTPPPRPQVHWVKTFAEKPNPQTAKLFFESGEFLWNSGIFIWRADVIMQQIAEHMPNWYSGLQEIAQTIGTPREAEVARRIFSALKGTSIDYGVMEHAPRVAVVSGTFDWSDVGSWDEVWRLLPQDERSNAIRGHGAAVEADRNLVLARDKLIMLVGVNDLIVVETDDALLICPREDSQRVRAAVDFLEKQEWNRYL